jgi:hypothetical protein
MLNFFQKLFSSASDKRPPTGDSSLPSSRSYHQSVLNDGSETATRGQLVQVVMRDLVRRSGIPPDWIQCQIQVVSSRKQGRGIFVRLVVKQWDQRLMRYAFAFQKALLTDIVQFEPKAAAWLQGIAWQLEVAGTCPLTDLPDSQYWKTHGVVDPFDIVAMPASAMPAHAPVHAPLAAPRFVAAVTPSIPAAPVIAEAVAPSFSLDALEPLPPVIDELPTPENDTAEDLERLFAIRDRELKQMAVSQRPTQGYEKTEHMPL